ncbi:hypothetical protein NEILACOT_05085 [Neisseria lactamica ATCC 23970]|uniref:Uncharacterized protein n=1 Tax=Neisseria lactamica ATCC 23970 TaxID=546265 RepID=D0WC06_NEILA|nr:hypothetical protein NEILACOT_05085 [Neisseria lactamica ATCC 23970]
MFGCQHSGESLLENAPLYWQIEMPSETGSDGIFDGVLFLGLY